MAAQHDPAILEQLIDAVEVLPEAIRGTRTLKQILEGRNEDGFDVVGLLLAEGSQEQLQLVEQLRIRFNLDLDAMAIGEPGTRVTLAGSLIGISILSGLVPMSQLEYLLNRDPPPRFNCAEDGRTLLHVAVVGQMSCTHRECS